MDPKKRSIDKAAQEMTDWKERDALGIKCKTVMKLVSGEQNVSVCDKDCPALAVWNTGEPVFRNDTCFIHKKNKKRVQLSSSYAPIKDMDGNIINVNQLNQGTDFKAEVTVSNPGTRGEYKEMALTNIFPSGWEILANSTNASSANIKDIPSYQNYRDDRVYTYFDLKPRESKTFVILLNATYPGKYYMSSTLCSAMYDNTIISKKPGKWITVVGKK